MAECRLKFDELTDLSGRVALVTGGGTGIGLMIAKGLASNGAKVYVAGRRSEVLLQASELLFDGQKRIFPLKMDVTDKESIQDVVDKITADDGVLHILVNNAGTALIATRTPFVMNDQAPERKNTAIYGTALFNSQTFEHWEDMFRANVASVFFVTYAFLGLLEASCSLRSDGATASVINISSVVANMRLSHSIFAYSSTKAAETHLTQMLATDLALKGIPVRVNGIAPGVFPSELMGSKERLAHYSKTPMQMLRPIPMQRPGTEEEISSLAVYLASPASGYMTGQEIAVDGGMSIVNP
ncbi:short-chain dehydrogenase [Schizopora paradoxa]|uniref:Short-chain dehydrogenase n=1 Tax=Schizopora paradoxa TaxID=27342 RepID=A0A0H2SLL1_9AGAM|nr:short-chain dehydrogenase [Schizopora paradoxa]